MKRTMADINNRIEELKAEIAKEEEAKKALIDEQVEEVLVHIKAKYEDPDAVIAALKLKFQREENTRSIPMASGYKFGS